MNENLLSRAKSMNPVTPKLRLPALADTGAPPPPQGPPPQGPPPPQQPLPQYNAARAPQPPPAKSSNSTCMIVGIILAVVAVGMIIVMAILAAIMLPALARAREAARRASCMNNLKQWGIVYKMYANENRDKYPVLEAAPGRFVFNADDIYPVYFYDSNILVCPSNPNQPGDAGSVDINSVIDHGRSYYYLGYAMTNEEQARAFLDAYRQRLREGGDFSEDLEVPAGMGFGGSDRIMRLQEGVERFEVEDFDDPLEASVAQSEIPVMIDRDTYHIPGGINVLYMDGHVEFLKMESKWPAQQWFLDELAEIDPETI